MANGNLEGADLSRLYRERFNETDLVVKRRVWEVLCRYVFQQYVGESDTVLDLGAGTCEFTNAIRCGKKIIVDLNPDCAMHAPDAWFVQSPSTDLSAISDGSVDVVFASNFFEHLPDKDAVLGTLRECYRILRIEGSLLLLQPNLRYLPGRYWDYFDHHTPLTHVSMVEALRLSGFRPERVVPRFLPYTVKQTRFPKAALLLRLYLRLPLVWPVFGRQMLIVARRAPVGSRRHVRAANRHSAS